jgi:hypothetical protein
MFVIMGLVMMYQKDDEKEKKEKKNTRDTYQ